MNDPNTVTLDKYLYLGALYTNWDTPNGPSLYKGRRTNMWMCQDCGCTVAARMVHKQVCLATLAMLAEGQEGDR